MVSRFARTGLGLSPSLSKAKDWTGPDLQTLGILFSPETPRLIHVHQLKDIMHCDHGVKEIQEISNISATTHVLTGVQRRDMTGEDDGLRSRNTARSYGIGRYKSWEQISM